MVMKLRSMRWAWHAVKKPEEKRSLTRTRQRWEDINMHLK
jgi:hypothetical protein